MLSLNHSKPPPRPPGVLPSDRTRVSALRPNLQDGPLNQDCQAGSSSRPLLGSHEKLYFSAALCGNSVQSRGNKERNNHRRLIASSYSFKGIASHVEIFRFHLHLSPQAS